MSSAFFGLNIAYSGLLASNAALNTTANNISNVQTDGYSRQQVNQQAAQAIRTFQTYGCAGAGVETLAIERVRDEFYDQKYWNNNTSVGEYDMKSYYMKQLEGYFYDTGTNAGFSTVFSQMMMTGLEELLKDPSSSTLKSQFVGYASQLTDYFNGVYGNLQKMQADVNSEIKLKVDEINSIAGEIATLNKQINTVEMGGQTANELRDRRTLLVDQLSAIVDVQTIETPIVDANDPERETGGNRFIVKIAGGQTLVDTNEFNGLECRARETYEKVNQSDIDGLYDVYWENGQKFSLYNAAMGGALKGLVQMRDGNNAEYFNGTITGTSVNGYTDDKGGVHDTVTVRVDEAYLQDLNKSNMSDQGGVINLGNQEFYYDSWDFSIDVDASGNATYSYTFVLSNNTELNPRHITNDRVDKTASVGNSVAYQGIPYYMSQMNEWVRTFSETFNDVLLKGDDNSGTIMLTGDHATDANQFQFDDASKRFDVLLKEIAAGTAVSASVNINVKDDSYYRLTAGNMSILTAVASNPDLMCNKYTASDGAESNNLLQDLKKVATDKDVMSFRGASASEFLQNVLSDVALNASAADTFLASYKNISDSIETTRLSISGVDEDEEAVNLVKYQNAYNLASKMISVFKEIYDRLILETGV